MTSKRLYYGKPSDIKRSRIKAAKDVKKFAKNSFGGENVIKKKQTYGHDDRPEIADFI